jgi:hypothetical protein
MFNPFLLATTYGHKPQTTDVPDEFKLRVYTGGLAGPNTADKCAAKALDAFKSGERLRGLRHRRARKLMVPVRV